MNRFIFRTLCATTVVISLSALCRGGAAPTTQPDSRDALAAENQALRKALVDLDAKNAKLEADNAKLKAEVKSLQERLAKIAVPQVPRPYQFNVPSPALPSQPQQNQIPRSWVPKKYGNTDFYVIPLKARSPD